MTKEPKTIVTNESVSIVWKGKAYNVTKGAPNFKGLKEAIEKKDWAALPKYLTVNKSVEAWSNNQFTVSGGRVKYQGKDLPENLNQRIMEMTTRGENPKAVYNFWIRLQKNPSNRSVDLLWDFLKHKGIPLTDDGCFLAYKGVRNDYRDAHSGTFLNKPGAIMEMPRNAVADDPRVECDEGFHVGALGYAQSFSQRVVVVKVDPKDVVSIPYDHSSQKMRTCKYEVLGNHNGELLSSTAFSDPDISDEAEAKFKEGIDTEAPEEPDEELEIHDKEAKQVNKGKVTKPPVKRKAHKFDKLDTVELLGKSLDELRNYATYGLLIIGASKIPGGKVALVSRIMEVRKKPGKDE